MVHALQEAWRVLKPGGSLVDLRPVADRWPVQVVGGQVTWTAGQMEDRPTGLAADAAAAHALEEAGRRGWFTQERAATFHVRHEWSTPEEMKEYIAGYWGDDLALPDGVFAEAQRRWADAEPPGRVQVRLTMQIARWRKLPGELV